ncbi:MAG: DUF4178 domain-containing protein [Methylotenera sp.]|nr:DUF4178 domain-containing protein [Oligoflexia bacterium]
MEYTCPSCGAAVHFKSRATVFSVCTYCKSMLVRHDLNLESLGKMSELLEDMSPLQVGTRGVFERGSFEIIGRLKIGWPQGTLDGGTWNEWFLQLDDGRQGWLGEAQGFYMISFPEEDRRGVPAVSELVPGKNVLLLGGKTFVVDDIKQAQCIGSEGELPFRAPQGRKNVSVDLSAAPGSNLSGTQNAFASLDYSSDGVKLYVGKYLEFDDFKFTGLRELDGW